MHWNKQENKLFSCVLCLQYNWIPQNGEERILGKLHALMAEFIEDKDRKQCRTHYKHLIKNKGKTLKLSCKDLAKDIIRNSDLKQEQIREILINKIEKLGKIKTKKAIFQKLNEMFQHLQENLSEIFMSKEDDQKGQNFDKVKKDDQKTQNLDKFFDIYQVSEKGIFDDEIIFKVLSLNNQLHSDQSEEL